jgi:hypothetical protein
LDHLQFLLSLYKSYKIEYNSIIPGPFSILSFSKEPSVLPKGVTGTDDAALHAVLIPVANSWIISFNQDIYFIFNSLLPFKAGVINLALLSIVTIY